MSYRTSDREVNNDSIGSNEAPTASVGSKATFDQLIFEGSWIVSDRSSVSFKYTDFENLNSSRPDTLFSFYLPGFNWVVRFNVLPILNGIYTYYSQKKQIVDPKQAGMMQMMPLIFLFIFWNFPSGLVLYWIIQAVLTTFQQTIFNRLHEKEQDRGKASKSASPLAARAARRTKKRG